MLNVRKASADDPSELVAKNASRTRAIAQYETGVDGRVVEDR
jgi:hypothetical protein